MELDDIPQKQTDGFPPGVSEYIFRHKEALAAFLMGLHLADDSDVYSGKPFRRDNHWIIRVQIGDW